MKLPLFIERWRFNRDLKDVRRKWARLAASSPYYLMKRQERRRLAREIVKTLSRRDSKPNIQMIANPYGDKKSIKELSHGKKHYLDQAGNGQPQARPLARREGEFLEADQAREQIAGKLLAVTETDKSPVLQLLLFSGEVKQVGVSTQLKRVPWAEFIGKDVFITFAATAKSKYGTPTKLFDVDVVE